MKRFIGVSILVGIVLFSIALVMAENYEPTRFVNRIQKLEPKTIEKIPTQCKLTIIDMSMNAFLEELAFKESSGNWKSVNKYGYIGLYQFGKSALKDAGYRHIKTDDFIENPNIFPPKEQQKAIKRLMAKNLHYLRRYIRYDRTFVGGVYVTISGMLAASHLVGNRSVRQFLKSNGKNDKCDANGVKCSDYMKHFSGYYIGSLL